ncbi:MAG: tetraacyldisaccharide 4'-kinase [Gemmatimonadota bacterium]
MTLGDRLRLRVPGWWRSDRGLAGRVVHGILAPAEIGFRGAAAVRGALYDRGVLRSRSASIPVVSVGNISVGGTGKTPVSAWIAALLEDWGHAPAVVMRGYGDDEAALHRELNPGVPVFAARRRIEAAEAAEATACDCVVLDDGFQHRALSRDLDIVLIAAEHWSGNRHLLPRGPWREPILALRRAGIVLVTRKTATAEEAARVVQEMERRGFGGPTGMVNIAPAGLVALDAAPGTGSIDGGLGALHGRSVLAIASIGDPRPFVEHIAAAGARPELLAYPDHHDYTQRDIASIVRKAAGRPIVATKKDAVKLRKFGSFVEGYVLEQEVLVEQGRDELEHALRAAVAGRR